MGNCTDGSAASGGSSRASSAYSFMARVRLERRTALLRTIEAIRFYAATHDGKLPPNLAAIKEVAVPIDPFDGKPLRLKRLADGWLVYATGTDGQDHGGTLDRQKMYQAGSDIGRAWWCVPVRRAGQPT